MSNPFLNAIDVLQERGWAQNDGEHRLGHPDGPFCLALAMSATGTAKPRDYVCLVDQLTDDKPQGLALWETIWRWNDDPSRSFEDVILALKRAAEAWDEGS